MANIIKRQLIQDGPRNVVVKVQGILDTSDIAATGEIGASGFTTTIGLKTIEFVAGALVPVVGQFVTFSDSAATFVAGTYITSITDATHVVVNNAALKTNAAAAVTITGTAGAVVIIDPAELSVIGQREGKATRVSIQGVKYAVEDALSAYLYWEATADDLIVPLEGQGEFECIHWLNTEASGVSGQVLLATQGWAGGTTLSFAVEVTVKKYQK